MCFEMRAPLLKPQNVQKKTSCLHIFFTTFTILSFALLGTFLLFSSLFPGLSSSENLVGVSDLTWSVLLDTYFAIGSLQSTMIHGSEFRGPEDPKIPEEECECAPKCFEICQFRLNPEKHFTYDVPNNCPSISTADGEPKACTHRSVKTALTQCWNPALMRCWNTQGDTQISDGNNEWTLLKHYSRMDAMGTSQCPFMHLRSTQTQIDFIIFGWGSNRLIPELCNQLSQTSPPHIRNILQTIPPSQSIVFGGHSEGSGWALCANMLMNEMSLPHERRVLTSGTLMADLDFIEQYNAVSHPSHNLAMLNAKKMPDGFMQDEIVADTQTMRHFPTGASFPQFGFTCITDSENGEVTCVIPQPLVNLTADFIRPADEQHLLEQMILPQLHSYDDYRECFSKCRSHFQEIGETFASNVPTYVKTGDVARPSFYARGDSVDPSLPGAASSSVDNENDEVNEPLHKKSRRND